MSPSRYLLCGQCGQWLRITALLVCLIQTLICTQASEDALDGHYTPVAMDESLQIIRPPQTDVPSLTRMDGRDINNGGSDPMPRMGNPLGRYGRDPHVPMYGRGRQLEEEIDSDMSLDDDIDDGRSPSKYAALTRSKNKKVLYSDEIELTPALTKMIGQGEDREPVFIRSDPVKAKSFRTQGSKLLASYNFVVPLLIPAVKRKSPPVTQPPKMIKETITEMVPVKNVAPRIREIYKAERVPQEVVTDFVTTERGLPNQVDDTLKSNERVLATNVENFD